MEILSATTKVSGDGVLTVQLPSAFSDATVDYVLTVQRKDGERPDGVQPLDEQGWPVGFLDRYAGCIKDPNFRRQPQGEAEPVPSLA